MIDQDHLGLVPRLQPSCEQRELNRDHAEKQEVVAREHSVRRIEAPDRDHQADGDAAEQAGPALLEAETKQFIRPSGPPPPRHQETETPFARDEPA